MSVKEQINIVNGVKVCSALNPGLRSFCLALYIRAGSIFEDLSDNGISHFYEHIVFRNLKNKYSDFYQLMATHGIALEASTYKEFIRFAIIGPSCEFDFASEILCSIFDDINVPRDELDKEKKRIKAEMREADQRTSLDYYFNKLVWKNTNAENTVLGYCKVLDRLTLSKLNSFRNECFAKENFFIYITGNVSQNELNCLNDRISSLDLPNAPSARKNVIILTDEFFNRCCTVNIKNGCWHYVKIGFDLDCSKHNNGVLELLYNIMFSYDKALVYNYLSEDSQIVYSYDSTLEQYDNAGNLNFMFEAEADKIEQSLRIVVRMLNDVKEGNFNFEASLKSEMCKAETELDNCDNINWSMAYYNHILKTVPLDYSDEYYGRFRITKEQVVEVAREIFRVKNMTVAVKGNKRKINSKNIENILRKLDN